MAMALAAPPALKHLTCGFYSFAVNRLFRTSVSVRRFPLNKLNFSCPPFSVSNKGGKNAKFAAKDPPGESIPFSVLLEDGRISKNTANERSPRDSTGLSVSDQDARVAKIAADDPHLLIEHPKIGNIAANDPPRQFAGFSVLNEDVRIAKIAANKLPKDPQASYNADTIAAIITALGGQQGSVAIVRLSGASAVEITSRLFIPSGRKRGSSWQAESHRVQYGTLADVSGSVIDEVLIIPMLSPRSYTREDVVEIQCHGGDICVRRILQSCLEAGARLAQPGEFTLRAFLNGRLDLVQAESVGQLISARSAVAAETALAGIQGGISSLVQALRLECLELLGDIESRVDFEDEMPALEQSEVVSRVSSVWERIEEALATAKRGQLLQAGLQVAIVGRPNVGKSSLLNAWSRSERAIVTDVPGTTRDVVEVDVVVGGISVKLLDTAGIRETDDVVESIGVERSMAAAKGADLSILVISASDGWTSEDDEIFHSLVSGDDDSGHVPSILVINKVDKAVVLPNLLPRYVTEAISTVILTCAIQRVGLHELESALLDFVGVGKVSSDGRQWAVNQRQAEQLVRASEALQRVRDSARQDFPIDMWTVDLKEAATALGQISGDDVTEEVLSSIFSRFCIGK